MKKELENTIKDVVKIVNNYAQSKEYTLIESLEKHFETLFDAQIVKLWKRDIYKDTLELFADRTSETIELDKSIIKKAIDAKDVLLVNHIASEKYFNASIDNPLDLKIKSLMVLPIIEGKNVIGVLKVWKARGEKKIFRKKDEESIRSFSPLLVRLLKSEEINKDELLTFIGKNDEQSPKRVVTKKKSDVKKVSVDKEDTQVQILKDKIDEITQENHTYLKALEDEKLKYNKLEHASTEFYSELQIQQKIEKELKEKLELFQKENRYLEKELKEKEKNIKSIQTLKSEKMSSSQGESKQDIENILNNIDSNFGDNEYTYMIFELILYAHNSKNALVYIEDNLKKSGVVKKIIDGYHFKEGLLIQDKKNRIEDLLKHIMTYEKRIFPNKIALKINVDKSVPKSLIFDKIKIQNIILHLLIDLYRFVDYGRNIHLEFTYKEKILTIEIGGYIHKKNSLFQTMFRQTKLGGDEKSRIGLQLSKKIIARLKGEITYKYKGDYYKFIVTLPAEVIKL